MEEQEPKEKKNLTKQENKGFKDFGRYSGLAFQMVALILLPTLGGVKLDKLTGWQTPVFTIILSLLGVFAAIYFTVKEFIK
jgi:F0F1-type ATP synthase assembly protein I